MTDIIFKIILQASALILWAGSVSAEIKTDIEGMVYPLLTYECDQAADMMLVTNSLLKGEQAKTFQYSDAEGTYSPWNMVELEEQDNSTKIVKTSNLVKTCTLSSGTYTATLEPQLFGRDLSGRCGASISNAITIDFDDVEILERTPFENFCHGNAPVIIRVVTFGKTGEVKIKRIPRYKFY